MTMPFTGKAAQEAQIINGIVANFSQARNDLNGAITALTNMGTAPVALADAIALRDAVNGALAVLQKDGAVSDELNANDGA